MNPWKAADLEFDAASFSGVVRLFPLPNLVLYPHVMQPLHVFEPRYRELLEDALNNDGLIAMAVLEPGWEADYEGSPPIAEYACLGKVITYHRLEDGRYNVLLLGVRRVRMVHELEPLRSFRQAEVELLDDCYDGVSEQELGRLQQELLEAFQRQLPDGCQASDQLTELLSQHLPLGLLTDLAAYTLPLDVETKQNLLSEEHVVARAKMLLEALEELSPDDTFGLASEGFPPRFSAN